VIKVVTGRQRPNYYDPETNKSRPLFHGPFYQFKKEVKGVAIPSNAHTSFPSGHTTVAFAAATVFAMEYHDRPLVPVISYTVASLIGLSRMTENKHWASDVFTGAGLGYLIGKQVVNNYHRYSRVKSQLLREKEKISFHLDRVNGYMVPGLTYTFAPLSHRLITVP
jgi:hypothetical protein